MSSPGSSRAAEDRELRAYLQRQRERERRIPRRTSDAPCELSFGQQRLWLLDRIGGGNLAYRIPFAMRISGGLDVAVLERSIAAIVARHESLRTRFRSDNGVLVQVVCGDVDVPLERVPLGDESGAGRDAAVKARFRDFAAKPLDLERGPLVRAGVLELSAHEHVVMVVMHHIISDAWSMGVFARELMALYQAFVAGRPSPLPALDIQYPDFAIWQRQRLRDDTLERHLSYWRDKLSGVVALELPSERRRPPRQSFDGRVQRLVLPTSQTDAMRVFSRQRGATLFMALLTGYAVMLYRYSGLPDLAVGSAITSRSRKELEGLIGFFVNMLVLRVDASGNPSFETLLERVRAMVLEAFEHQDAPFEMLVRELEPERDASRSPLAQVQFSMQSSPAAAETRVEGLKLSAVPEDVSATRFDLECHVVDEAGGLVLQFIYNTALFDASTVAGMLDAYVRVLGVMSASPRLGIDDFDLLSAEERKQLLVEWNAACRTPDPGPTVLDRFRTWVSRDPAAPAIKFRDILCSYAELDAQTDALARYLQTNGVEHGDRVGICVERGPFLVQGILAVWKAGAAYLPLDPEYPQARLRFMLQDAQLRCVLTQASVMDRVRAASDGQTLLDIGRPVDTRYARGAAPDAPGAHDLAYMIYTSGSTGEPKGVLLRHEGLGNVAAEQVRAFGVGPGHRVLQFSSPSFDAGTFDLAMALGSGATLVLADAGLLQPGPPLARLLREEAVTVLTIPPSALSALPAPKLPSLSVLNVAGEACSAQLVERWLSPGRRMFNLYGPTEATIWSTMAPCVADGRSPPIGRPIGNVPCYVLDPHGRLAPVGVPGELHVGGVGVAAGYWHRDALNAQRFLRDPFAAHPEARMYRTGDRVRWRADGQLEFLGRIDSQVKVRGYRIELGEVEHALSALTGVREAVAVVRKDDPGDERLVAYVVPADEGKVAPEGLRMQLKERLPGFMVPSALVVLASLPLTPNGKVDRDALPAPEHERQTEQAYVAPRSELEQRIAGIWREVLGVGQVGVNDNFFDLGGHSLLLPHVHARLESELGHEVPMVALFEFPSVAALAASLRGESDDESMRDVPVVSEVDAGDTAVAIIAMTGRFPGAPNVEVLWSHLSAGTESIRFFSADELAAAGVPRTLIDDPGYVPARGSLDDVELFDAAYFGYTPREAELMDPQHRLFLECAAEALERGGYDPARYPGAIGVFAGCSNSGYVYHLRSHPELVADAGGLAMLVANDKDFLTTRVSYKLDLRGPSVTVQTACSTSLVAVHEACRSLRDRECDMALAGGVSVNLPRVSGYTHVEHSILSRDGHCRAFDAAASGTVTGEGVAVVLLKRLADAVRDGDPIQAVVLGTAINNDGSDKVGYTAPSVRAQARVVAAAQARAGVAPRTIGYLEAHGTGTSLGDPIEVAALNRVFAADAEGPARCAMGSIKSNIGHLDTAAGAAGLIKVGLALKHRKLPPSVNFTRPNPEIDFAGGPFYVNAELEDWPRRDAPRRAAVSSFGIGGTNAHAVLEEAPECAPSGPSRGVQMLPVSAMTEQVLDELCDRLADYLEQHPQAVLADFSYTLRRGRRELPWRRAVTCHDNVGAVAALRARPRNRRAGDGNPPVVFLFPGQGTQYPDMGRALYDAEPVFRETVDHCCDALTPVLGLDLRTLLYRSPGDETELWESLRQTRWTQPALFVTEYALARLWMNWGIRPTALVGHSVGEIVAACVAGTMPLDAALDLVARRGRCMDEAPAGAMLAVPLSEAALRERLEPGTWVAAINAPAMSVAAGGEEAIETLRSTLASDGIEARRLHTSHAFHCPLLDDAADALKAVAAAGQLDPPSIPYLSNVTGDWTSAAELEPGYWARQMRAPVQFSKCLERLLHDIPDCVMLEAGPGRTLTSLARQQPGAREVRTFTSSLPGATEQADASVSMAAALADLWCAGATIDWDAYDAGQDRHRVLLPTYPYQRRRYWVEPAPAAAAAQRLLAKSDDVGDWAYVPSWRRSAPLPRAIAEPGRRWLVIGEGAFSDALAAVLARDRVEVSVVAGDEPLELLVPDVVILAPGVDVHDVEEGFAARCDSTVLAQLSRIARWLSGARAPVRLVLVQRATHDVLAGEPVQPVAAALLSACRVLSQELAPVQWRAIDLPPGSGDTTGEAEMVAREVDTGAGDEVVAYRGGRRWIQAFEPMPLPAPAEPGFRIRRGGTYLLTGGLGRIGTAIGVRLGEAAGANVVVTTRALDGDDERAASKRRAIERIEAAGGRVLTVEVDLTDGAALERAVKIALERFGRIDGVIHAAGITAGEGFAPIAELGDHVWRDHLNVKLGAAIHLERILVGHDPDFMIAMGSLSGVLGGLGMGAYAAANAALAAHAGAAGETGRGGWCCIEWDGWRFDDGDTDSALARLSMTPGEGLEVLWRVLSVEDVSRIVVSTAGIDLRRARTSTNTVDEAVDGTGERYQRPEMGGYVAPRNDTERVLADVWGRLLGVDPVGVEDNFLDLGGHSLLATQIISRVQQQFGVKVQLAELISGATIAHLAGVIDNAHWAKDAAAAGAPIEQDQREVGEL